MEIKVCRKIVMTRDEEINLIADCAVPDDKYKEFKDGIVWGC